MTAAQVWLKFGGLIESNEKWLLVDLHKIGGERAIKPTKNMRFRYQVMMNDTEQSLPVQFRSLKNAREFFYGQMEHDKFQKLLAQNSARMFFGRAA